MRAVIDTNVLLSGLLWHGAPHTLIEFVRSGSLSLVSSPASRDPDDDHVLALAIAARADLIVSGDHDLRALNSFQDIPIFTPAEAVNIITAA